MSNMKEQLTDTLRDVVFTTRQIITNYARLPRPPFGEEHRAEWHPRIGDWWAACVAALDALNPALQDQRALDAHVAVKTIMDPLTVSDRERQRYGEVEVGDKIMAVLRHQGIPARWDEKLAVLADCISAMESPADGADALPDRSVPMTLAQVRELFGYASDGGMKQQRNRIGLEKAARGNWSFALSSLTSDQRKSYNKALGDGLYQVGKRL